LNINANAVTQSISTISEKTRDIFKNTVYDNTISLINSVGGIMNATSGQLLYLMMPYFFGILLLIMAFANILNFQSIITFFIPGSGFIKRFFVRAPKKQAPAITEEQRATGVVKSDLTILLEASREFMRYVDENKKLKSTVKKLKDKLSKRRSNANAITRKMQRTLSRVQTVSNSVARPTASSNSKT
jgi:hypothetical protein